MKEINWSVPLESEEYEEDIELMVKDAIEAIEETAAGYYVNLVTPACHGHPDSYLLPQLKNLFGPVISTKYIDQCGCGGFVYRVWKNSVENN